MRLITGFTGCPKGLGSAEMQDDQQISVRVVDCADEFIAVRIGAHPESARITAEEAYYLSRILVEAADRASARSPLKTA